MAVKVHEVKNYQYSFDARTGGPGRLHLWGSSEKIAEVRFVDDTSPVPTPVITPDLNRATVFFKRSALSELIDLLRSQRRISVSINDQGLVDISRTYGLTDSLVACATCSPELLAAKRRGILEAMRRLVDYCGSDAPATICPITFHLDGDDYCGPYQSGMTGGFSVDPLGHGHVCLYDVEKENRMLPFTVENAQKIQDQLLPVHEAMHGWFVGRQNNYRIEEPFCKLLSFIISEAPGGPDYCDWFSSTPDDHPDVLMKHLCNIGMNAERAALVLARLAQFAADKGEALTDAEFAGVVTDVIGQNAVPAFQLAGILP